MSLLHRAQIRLSIVMPDAGVRLAGRAQSVLVDVTRGRVGGRQGGAPVMTLTTVGRKSGERRSTAVIYGRDGERLVVIGSNTGSERTPAWALNLEANPEAEIVIGGDRRHVSARLVGGEEERERLWDEMNAIYGGFGIYTGRTDRQFKVFVLDEVERP
jgi:F420H(2)-dependent quinone reductase